MARSPKSRRTTPSPAAGWRKGQRPFHWTPTLTAPNGGFAKHHSTARRTMSTPKTALRVSTQCVIFKRRKRENASVTFTVSRTSTVFTPGVASSPLT